MRDEMRVMEWGAGFCGDVTYIFLEFKGEKGKGCINGDYNKVNYI